MNWLLDPIRNHYADFEGRATRQQYWMFFLMAIVASIVLTLVDTMLGLMGALPLLFQLGILLPSIAIAARRLHDTGKSGWWQLVVFVPLVGVIVLIVMLALKGDAGPNKYDAATTATPGDIPSPATSDQDMSDSETEQPPQQ